MFFGPESEKKCLHHFFHDHFSLEGDREDAKDMGEFKKIEKKMVRFSELGRKKQDAMIDALTGEFTSIRRNDPHFHGVSLDDPRFRFFVGKVPVQWIVDITVIERDIENAFDDENYPIEDIDNVLNYVVSLEKNIIHNGFDELRPLLLTTRGGYFMLLGGNHRLQAVRNLMKAKALEKDYEVPVAIYDYRMEGETCRDRAHHF